MATTHHHRATLKQKNKKFKSSTKKSLGKVKEASKKNTNPKVMSKKDRKNRAKLLAAQRNSTLNLQKDIFVGENGVSKVITVVSLSDDLLEADAARLLHSEKVFYCERLKQNFHLLIPTKDPKEILESVVASDFVLFVAKDEELEESGRKILESIRLRYVPQILMAVLISNKNDSQRIKKEWNILLQTEFSRDVLVCDLESDRDMLLTQATKFSKKVSWRNNRPYLIPTKTEVIGDSLSLTGFMRGKPFNPNQIVHVSGCGDFQIKEIRRISDGFILQSDAMERETLEAYVDDPFDEEKMWENEEMAEPKETVLVPKGTSYYQSRWLSDDEDAVKMTDSEGEEMEEIEVEKRESMHDLSASEEKEQYEEFIKKKEEEQEELEYPDQVFTPTDISARERFQKYRGLKNFRNANWDRNENLPKDYSKIFQIENYNGMRNEALKAVNVDCGFKVGDFVEILLQIPQDVQVDTRNLIAVHGLLKYEQKFTLTNFTITKVSDSPIKSKEPVIIYCGVRRFIINPIYSEAGNHSLNKYLRFMSAECTGSAYMPICFTPAPITIFSMNHELLAYGSVLQTGPQRMMIKRIILTGDIFKVHRKSAVVRYMFHSPLDIHWFKPVELKTNSGRHGYIKESLGTHGYMKCIFDGPVTQMDNVQMCLYKRVYPKWTTQLLK